MPAPIRNLPVLQNWDCHQCGSCCTDYWVPVTESERQRIEAQGWDKEPGFEGKKLFVRYGGWFGRRKFRLNQVAGDRCIFLDDKGLCRIHAKFGSDAKPFACQLYPYIFTPVGDHYRISLRFACPSAVRNLGRPLDEQLDDLKAMARGLERWHAEMGYAPMLGEKGELTPPPRLRGRQQLEWKDLLCILDALTEILQDEEDPFPRRMLRALELVKLCRQATFEKITGARLREFLELVVPAMSAETPEDLTTIPRPGWVGRVLFRSLLSVYLRKDQGTRTGIKSRGRLALMWGLWRMARGRGRGMLPQLQAGLPRKTFNEMEEPLGPLPQEVEATLERYYTIKLEALQFCGPSFFHYPVWKGFEMLALTLPMILWLARGYREQGIAAAVNKAITVIDENYGYAPQLAGMRIRTSLGMLRFKGEIERLVAWYSR
jgi:lysine-N-methylase